MDGIRRVLRGHAQYFVALGGFLDLLAVALILPPLSSHLKALGLASWQRGFVLSSYGVLQFVSGPVIGSISDAGHRKRVFLICTLCTACSYCLLGFSSSSIVWALLARALAGIFKHSQTLSKALLCDASVTSGATRSGALARFNGASSVGFIVGPVLGGHLLQAYPIHGFAICCQLAAFLFVLNALLTRFCLSIDDKNVEAADSLGRCNGDDKAKAVESDNCELTIVNSKNDVPDDNDDDSETVRHRYVRDSKQDGSVIVEKTKPGIYHQLTQPFVKIGQYHIWDLFLTKFLGGCSVLVFRYDVNQRLTDFYEATPRTHGYVTSYGAIAAALFSAFIVDRVGSSFYSKENTKLLYHTTLLHAAALTLLALAPNLPIYVVALTLLSYTNASNRVTFTQVTMERGGGKGSASLIGLCQSVMSVSRIASPVVAGFIQETFLGLNGPPLLAICLAAGSAAVARTWLIPAERTQNEKREKMD